MEMPPKVRIGDWIVIGDPLTEFIVDGLVLGVYSDYIAVGYHQNKIKAIKDDVVWQNGHWKFKYSGPHGSYLRGSDEAAVKRGPPR